MLAMLLLYAIIGLVILLVVILIKNGKAYTDDEFSSEIYDSCRNTKSSTSRTTHHSEEYLWYLSNLNTLSYAELDKMHSVLAFDYLTKWATKDMAALMLLEQGKIDVQEFNRRSENNKYAIIENGPIYGCYTYREADNLNRAIVRQIDYFDSIKRR